MSVTVRPATAADIDWVTELYAANQRDALTPQQRAEQGFVQGRMDADTLERRLGSDTPSLVAEVDGRPAGVLLTSPVGAFRQGPPGLTVETAQEAGITDAFLCGPALVTPEARGHGVLRALSDEVFAWAAGRYAHGVAFVEDENHVSRQVHERLGWRPVGTFTWQDRGYTVLAHDVDAPGTH